MSDRLTLTRAFESSGMQSAVAERIATEIYDAIHNNVATKTDLRELEQRLDLCFEQLERRIDGSSTTDHPAGRIFGGAVHPAVRRPASVAAALTKRDLPRRAPGRRYRCASSWRRRGRCRARGSYNLP